MGLVSKEVRSDSASAALTRYFSSPLNLGLLDSHWYSKLVDTKSTHNTTLLHFLERTVAKHFPEMEQFLEELSAPAEAYRGLWCRQ